jgi:catechol 2,3-dioxygenase-like lactoylglutathione lyase family enzyme
MQLVQSRVVTDDVAGLAAFYARLLRTSVVLNDYYVEIPTAAGPAGGLSVGFSKRRFTECSRAAVAEAGDVRSGEVILDFRVDDVDAEFARIDGLGVEWLLPPTTQPWGNRSMILRDPEGHLLNIYAPTHDVYPPARGARS